MRVIIVGAFVLGGLLMTYFGLQVLQSSYRYTAAYPTLGIELSMGEYRSGQIEYQSLSAVSERGTSSEHLVLHWGDIDLPIATSTPERVASLPGARRISFTDGRSNWSVSYGVNPSHEMRWEFDKDDKLLSFTATSVVMRAQDRTPLLPPFRFSLGDKARFILPISDRTLVVACGVPEQTYAVWRGLEWP